MLEPMKILIPGERSALIGTVTIALTIVVTRTIAVDGLANCAWSDEFDYAAASAARR